MTKNILEQIAGMNVGDEVDGHTLNSSQFSFVNQGTHAHRRIDGRLYLFEVVEGHELNVASASPIHSRYKLVEA